MKESPIHDHPLVLSAIASLRASFETIGHAGPAQYARFERVNGTDDERVGLARFAHGSIIEFLRFWDAQ